MTSNNDPSPTTRAVVAELHSAHARLDPVLTGRLASERTRRRLFKTLHTICRELDPDHSYWSGKLRLTHEQVIAAILVAAAGYLDGLGDDLGRDQLVETTRAVGHLLDGLVNRQRTIVDELRSLMDKETLGSKAWEAAVEDRSYDQQALSALESAQFALDVAMWSRLHRNVAQSKRAKTARSMQ